MYFSFTKYHGLGNDFIVIDDRQELFPIDDSALIAHLCHRRTGIGSDGLILLQDSFKADYSMRIFDAEGKEVAMCGNGLRCCMAFLRDQGLAVSLSRILVSGRIYDCKVVGNLISVQMGKVKEVFWNIAVSVCGKEVLAHCINTGVPHVVVFVDDVDQISVEEEGKEMRWHPLFQPKGANINYVSELCSGMLKMRTFERVLERETLACGTGAAAVAFAASKMHGYLTPLKILTASNEVIEIRISNEEEIEMIGGATGVFKGNFSKKGLRCIAV